MGQASDITSRITSLPLSIEEQEDRRAAEQVRPNVETTLDGEVVERVSPKVAPRPTFQAEPSTWD
jgi:hypothetical protein